MRKNNDIIVLHDVFEKKKDYPNSVYKTLYSIENNHFWFLGRNRIIQIFLSLVFPDPESIRFLEVGCGTGFVLSFLEKLGFQVTGLDMNLEGLIMARKRTDAKLICSDAEHPPRIKVDAIGAFDVIEHMDDEIAFLRGCRKMLKPGGYIFLTVPANALLWSNIDTISGHKRRYNLLTMTSVLEKSGFTISRMSYFNMFLMIPQMIFRKISVIKNKKNISSIVSLKRALYPPPFIVNIIFKYVLFVESVLLRYVTFPLGASIIVAARKK